MHLDFAAGAGAGVLRRWQTPPVTFLVRLLPICNVQEKLKEKNSEFLVAIVQLPL